MKLWPFECRCPACNDSGTDAYGRFFHRFCDGRCTRSFWGDYKLGPHLHRSCEKCGLRFMTYTKQDMVLMPTGGEVSLVKG